MANRPLSTIVLAAALVGAPAAAQAMGLCENLSATWRLDSVSERASQIVISGELEWCEETDDGEERGVVHAAQIRDFSDQVAQWYLRETGVAAAQHLGRIAQNDAALPMDKLTERKKAQDFVAPERLLKSPSGRCSAKVVEKKGDADAVDLTLTVTVGGKVVWSTPLGEGVASDEERSVLPLFLPEKRALLIWAALPRCEGGPPPGYFGEDDPGECYVETALVLKLQKAEGTPLAACFAAAKSAPPKDGPAKSAPTPPR